MYKCTDPVTAEDGAEERVHGCINKTCAIIIIISGCGLLLIDNPFSLYTLIAAL